MECLLQPQGLELTWQLWPEWWLPNLAASHNLLAAGQNVVIFDYKRLTYFLSL